MKEEWSCICCANSSEKSPDKYAFLLPGNIKQKNVWLKILSSKCCLEKKGRWTDMHICEDHFDLPNDLQNHVQFKLYRHLGFRLSERSLLKPGVVPTKFQPKREEMDEEERRNLVIDAIAEAKTTQCQSTPVDMGVEAYEICEEDNDILNWLEVTESDVEVTQPVVITKSACVGPGGEHRRSFGIQCTFKPHYRSRSTNYIRAHIAGVFGTASQTPFFKKLPRKVPKIVLFYSELRCRNPSKYLGIPSDHPYLLPTIVSKLNCDQIHVQLVLEKIKRNFSFQELGDRFVMNAERVEKRYLSYLTKMKRYLKRFVFWPESGWIRDTLPEVFKETYPKCKAVLNCLEIKIKPKSDFLKTMTWSEKAQAHILKYLILSTPNGFITYISKGFYGGFDETELVIQSQCLRNLPPSSTVIADDRFQYLEPYLEQNSIQLIHPPALPEGDLFDNCSLSIIQDILLINKHINLPLEEISKFELFKSPNNTRASLHEALVVVAALNNIKYINS